MGNGSVLSWRVCSVSPIEGSCLLRAWACVSVCVEEGRESVSVCLCALHCSDWESWGCFKQAALPMWPAQPQAGIHYGDTHTLALSPPSLSLCQTYTHHVHIAPPSHGSGYWRERSSHKQTHKLIYHAYYRESEKNVKSWNNLARYATTSSQTKTNIDVVILVWVRKFPLDTIKNCFIRN